MGGFCRKNIFKYKLNDNPNLDGKDVCVTKCTADYCVLHNIGNNINPGKGHYGKCEVSKNHNNHIMTPFAIKP